ncbi:MAG: hypothetical protein GWP08_04430 [Nitrospiraceae bacterium]|nr:hypothetical protein [Nitrospiraceae bacterium]
MQETLFPSGLPSANNPLLTWLSIGFCALFFGAVVLELLRRRWRHRDNIAAQWGIVEEIIREKGLTGDEAQALRDMLRAHAPQAPLTTINERLLFEECVTEQMEALSSRGNAVHFERVGGLLRQVRRRLNLEPMDDGRPVGSTRQLDANHMMWISPGDAKRPKWFRVHIADVDEAYLHVVPDKDEKGPPPSLQVGDMCSCRVLRVNDARYAFTSVLALKSDNPLGWSFLHTMELDRLQSRAFFRIAYHGAANLGILMTPRDGNLAENVDRREVETWVQGQFTNISAGGFAVIATVAPPNNARVRVPLEFPGEDAIEPEAYLIETRPLSGGRYLVRGEFTDIAEDTRDAIARFVLHQQQPLPFRGEEPPEEGA